MRILFVEDEKRMAQALCEILRLEKYEVDHYTNGLEGLAALERNIYDIVILDVMLPAMNGYEIAKALRKNQIPQKTTVQKIVQFPKCPVEICQTVKCSLISVMNKYEVEHQLTLRTMKMNSKTPLTVCQCKDLMVIADQIITVRCNQKSKVLYPQHL